MLGEYLKVDVYRSLLFITVSHVSLHKSSLNVIYLQSSQAKFTRTHLRCEFKAVFCVDRAAGLKKDRVKQQQSAVYLSTNPMMFAVVKKTVLRKKIYIVKWIRPLRRNALYVTYEINVKWTKLETALQKNVKKTVLDITSANFFSILREAAKVIGPVDCRQLLNEPC